MWHQSRICNVSRQIHRFAASFGVREWAKWHLVVTRRPTSRHVLLWLSCLPHAPKRLQVLRVSWRRLSCGRRVFWEAYFAVESRIFQYDMIRFDTVYLTCSRKLTGSQVSLLQKILTKNELETRRWHVAISCQPDGRPPQPVLPWKSGRVHLAEGSNVVVLELPYSTEFGRESRKFASGVQK